MIYSLWLLLVFIEVGAGAGTHSCDDDDIECSTLRMNFVGLVLHINFGEIEEAFWCRAFKALPGFRPENVKTPEMTHIAFKEKRDFISFV